MIYLLYGKEEFLIDEKIKSIIDDSKIDRYNIDKYDLENTNIKNIVDAALTISLFDSNKIIIVENSYIFTGVIKKGIEQDTSYLNSYFDNKNPNTILIFKVISEKIDSRKKIVTKIKQVAEVKEYNKIIDINSIVIKMFGEYKINRDCLNYLIDRVGSNLSILNQEIIKIKIYKDSDLVVTMQDIRDLTNKNVNIDIFNLIDNIIANNKEKALESYYEMIKLGEEPIKIIVMIANQFRLIYQVKELCKKGFNEYEMMDLLEQKPYPIKKARERINKYSSEELLNHLYKLAELDINIKSGMIEKNIGLELFILGI